MKKAILTVLWAVMVLVSAMPLLSTAAENPFVKDEYYHPKGGAVLMLEEFRENPRSYYRSGQAYELAVKHLGRVLELDVDLTPAAFDLFLSRGELVRAVECDGVVDTESLNKDGSGVTELNRPCYSGEQLLQVWVESTEEWVDFTSLACLNPVHDRTRASLPTEIDEAIHDNTSVSPAKKNCRWVKGPTAVSTGSVSVTLMPTGISTFCGPVIMAGGGVITTELPKSSFTSSRRVCDD